MNFVQLCQKLGTKAGIPGTGPTTVTGQAGELLRVVTWIKDAWTEIQNEEDEWKFMWVYGQQQPLLVNGRTYDPTVDWTLNVARFDVDTFKLYRTSLGVSDQTYVSYQPWQAFESRYNIGPVRLGKPSVFSLRPDGKVMFDSQLDDAYTAIFDFYRSAQVFAADTDIPYLNVDFHDAIWQKGLMYYAEYEEAGSTYATAKRDYDKLLTKMQRRFLPDLVWGDPLT